MQLKNIWSVIAFSAGLLLPVGEAAAQSSTETGPAERALATEFPPRSIDSVERAQAALALVPAARAEIERRTAYQRAQCYENFFTAACLNDLRDSERRAARAVRRVEVEANALLRRERAAERDRAVADRERRAAEQRAKSISITGTARNPEQTELAAPDAVTPPAATTPSATTPADASRP